MGYRDDMRFEEWFKKHLGLDFDEDNCEWFHLKMKSAYETGYNDGFKAAKDYDPQWDSD